MNGVGAYNVSAYLVKFYIVLDNGEGLEVLLSFYC